MGEVTITAAELEAMLDRSAKRGAKAALAELGLHDESASQDLNALRGLLAAWRDTRKTMWQTAVRIGTGSMLIFIAAAVWVSVKTNAGQ